MIFLLNIMFGMMLWLLDANAFSYLFPTIILGSLLLYCIVGIIVHEIEQRKEKELWEFIENPTTLKQEKVIKLCSEYDKEFVKEIGKLLREKNDIIIKQEQNMEDYEEYMESWAHEIKTPLALMTFVLDNRKEEISPTIYNRLEYARTIMQEDIERMLYYARLKSARSDYFFTELLLKDVCYEVIDDYKILLQEKRIKVITEFENMRVLSDKKGLQFLITQVISNSIKYQKEEVNSLIHFDAYYDKRNDEIKLIIQDNGIGVKSYDLPFVFEKGFTGEVGEQKKNSTGMGLYLAKQVANHLKIKVDITEEYKEGFEIVFLFPNSLDEAK